MKKTIIRFMAALVAIVLSSYSAYAATPFPTDGSPITSGTVYQVATFVDYNATFTATSSGTLIQDGCPELKLSGLNGKWAGYGQYGQVYTWEVEAGKTYTITNTVFIFGESYVCFAMENEQGVKLVNAIPEAGSSVNTRVNNTGEILLHFNTAMEMDNASLVCGNEQIELVNTSIQSNTLALIVTDALLSMYSTGAISKDGGTPFSIVLTGLRSVSGTLYNGDGILKLDYKAAPKLTDLVSANVPNPLKSYYPKGDPAGMMTFVFNKDLINDGSIFLTISCGNPESEGSYYYETLYPEVNGATLTFDLTGKQRDLETYIGLQMSPYVAVKLSNVRDIDGVIAEGSGSGNVASYDYSLSYYYIKPQAIISEFNPESGSSLEGVDEIEIWYNHADMILFDGVEFVYHTHAGFESAIVLKSELDIDLYDNEMTINVKVPEEVKGHDQITVKLYNQQALDGNTYRIEAYYDTFIVECVSPVKGGEAIASTGTADFTFSVNESSKYFYLRYDFYNDDTLVGGAPMSPKGDGIYTASNGDYTCYKDSANYIIVSAYYTVNDYNLGSAPAQTYRIDFVGTAPSSGIESVSADSTSDNAIYNIQGIRVDGKPAPGIYIINGKKAYIK